MTKMNRFDSGYSISVLTASICGVLMAITANPVIAQSSTESVAEMLENTGAGKESELAILIQNAVNSESIGGSFSAYQGSLVNAITPQEVALRVLERNLSIEDSRIENQLAEQATREAQAVFDPVLNLSVGLDRNESFDRTLTGTVVARVFNPIYEDPDTGQELSPGEIVLPEVAREDTGIERIVFNNLQEQREVRDGQEIFASKEDPNGAQTAFDFSVVLEQLTPWGVQYDLTLGSVHKEVFYDASGHSFDAPWATNLLLNVEVPIVNDFGEDSSASVESKVADLEGKRQEWLLKSRINTTLGQAAITYLELIRSAEQYRINLQNLELTERQLAATKRRFDSRNATAYEYAQIQAEQALAKNNAESAASSFLAASDSLLALSNDSSDYLSGRVLVPSDYSAWLESDLKVNLENARESALANRPELQAGMLEIAQAEVRQRNAVLRTRPDIRLKAGLGLEQNASVYGYDSVFSSWANVLDPDVATQNISAEYRYPIGNKGIKASKKIADATLKSSQLSEQQTRRLIELDVANAINRLQTALVVKSETKQQLDSAEKSYASLDRLARNGNATQNQIISGLRSLQSARTAYLQASLAIKQAEAALLLAEGTIDRNYAGWIAKNRFEGWRLAQLAKLDDFRFFVQ